MVTPQKHILADHDVVTVMPCTSQCQETVDTAVNALKSHKATCDAQVIVLDNSSPRNLMRDELKHATLRLGYTYRYSPHVFSLNGLWNVGTLFSKSDYVVHSSADVIFHEGWLDEILSVFKTYPKKYYSLHPCSIKSGPFDMGCNAFVDELLPGVVADTQSPTNYVNAFTRSNMHYWDEAFPVWASDTDYALTLKTKGLTAGVCRGSRVDTMLGGVYRFLGPVPEMFTTEGVTRFRRKWFHHINCTDEEIEEMIGVESW